MLHLLFLLALLHLSQAVDWSHGNWAFGCDFRGGDLSSAQIPGEQCGGRCANTYGCSHWTWTNYAGGTCWMKSGSASQNDAYDTWDGSMTCGVTGGNGGGNPPPPPPPNNNGGGSGTWRWASTTRYWDCSKPHCAWHNIWPNVGNQEPYRHDYAFKRCNGQCAYGAKYFGTAAASTGIMGGNSGTSACGKCYALRIPGTNNVPLVVQVNNLCPDYANPSCKSDHFDIAAPGFDFTWASASNTCQQKDPAVIFKDGHEVCMNVGVKQCNCDAVSTDPVLKEGCRLFVELGWDNQNVEYQEVSCPSGLISAEVQDTSASGSVSTQTVQSTSGSGMEMMVVVSAVVVVVVVVAVLVVLIAVVVVMRRDVERV